METTMEARTYTIPEDKREEVEKLVQRLQRKATRYNVPLEISMGKPHAAEVNYWGEDPFTGGHVIVHTDMVEAFDLTINGGIVRNGNYSVIAMLEHLDGGNVVTTFGQTEVKDAWRHAGCTCEHCGINRDRKLTFIVSDGSSEKQIGRTCLKDYCGINPDGIGINNELHDVFLDYDVNEVREYDPDRPVISLAYDTLEVLAVAIRITKRQGYVKSENPVNGNRWKMGCEYEYHNLITPITPEERAEAEAMAAEIVTLTEDENHWYCVLPNVKTLLEAGYCKSSHFGYIAYAPTEYKKLHERREKQRMREMEAEAQRMSSDYVGEVGKRQVFHISSFELVTSWKTDFGITYLYKFITTDGNVLVWRASGIFGEWITLDTGAVDFVEYKTVSEIKATVKFHNERDGVKQTLITRCKAVA